MHRCQTVGRRQDRLDPCLQGDVDGDLKIVSRLIRLPLHVAAVQTFAQDAANAAKVVLEGSLQPAETDRIADAIPAEVRDAARCRVPDEWPTAHIVRPDLVAHRTEKMVGDALDADGALGGRPQRPRQRRAIQRHVRHRPGVVPSMRLTHVQPRQFDGPPSELEGHPVGDPGQNDVGLSLFADWTRPEGGGITPTEPDELAQVAFPDARRHGLDILLDDVQTPVELRLINASDRDNRPPEFLDLLLEGRQVLLHRIIALLGAHLGPAGAMFGPGPASRLLEAPRARNDLVLNRDVVAWPIDGQGQAVAVKDPPAGGRQIPDQVKPALRGFETLGPLDDCQPGHLRGQQNEDRGHHRGQQPQPAMKHASLHTRVGHLLKYRTSRVL